MASCGFSDAGGLKKKGITFHQLMSIVQITIELASKEESLRTVGGFL